MSISILTIFALTSLAFAVQLRHGDNSQTPVLLNTFQRGPIQLGCFADNGARVLPLASLSHDRMTPELCSSYCRDYDYFGTEYSTQCFCGNTRPVTKANTCNKKCGGSNDICGGDWVLNLYQQQEDQSQDSNTYMGCFQDNGNRVLAEKTFSDGNMTPAMCSKFCQGYIYFGTEYSSQCFCGNTLPTTKSNACNMKCTGADEICGGTWTISVYRKPVQIISQTISIAPLGCFADNGGRVMNAKSTSANNMSTLNCFKFCQGYTYFGTEYSSQCFCSNTPPTVKAGNCDMKCVGANEMCGGLWALSVFKRL